MVMKLLERCDALGLRNAHLSVWLDKVEALQSTVQEQAAELESLRKDAERYRWLHDCPATSVQISKSELRTWLWSRPYGSGKKFDEAIDAAIVAAPKEK